MQRAQDFGFNPELVAKEKVLLQPALQLCLPKPATTDSLCLWLQREWSRHFSDNKVVDWPPNIFENFIIVVCTAAC